MAYIIKNTSGLVNTRVTDTGRLKMSQGNFNISYFQIGDSEVSYDKVSSSYNQANSFVLTPPFGSQNSDGIPQSNKQNIKYPYYVDGRSGNTYGIPFMDSTVEAVFNRAPLRGFFTGNTTASTISWSALTSNSYVKTSNYLVDPLSLNGTNEVNLIYNGCNTTTVGTFEVGDFITIYFDGLGCQNCNCTNLPTPTPTASLGSTPTPTPTPSASSGTINCASPTPTPTLSKTQCLTPTPSSQCPLPPEPVCLMSIYSCYPILTYRIVAVCENKITLDRTTPDFGLISNECCFRALVYPKSLTELYDSVTPIPHWDNDVINYETICDVDQFDVKIWNMNIPWTESPAGLLSTQFEDYTYFGSVNYIGSKEYFGYNSDSGQTFYVNSILSAETTDTYYYNSFDEVIKVEPKEQKAVAIIHYTNQTIDFFYGEKFAMEPYDPSNPQDTTGQARNFKLHIPWIMWHKNPDCCYGSTFWVDPPGFDGKNLFEVHYMESNQNNDMNNPGLRYFHLWDTYPNNDGLPSRIGKVFPDNQMIIIDDEEIVAAMSYKANRNWTLPAPQLSLITPNICDTTSPTTDGILTGNGETMFITYRLTNDYGFTNSLHCNYYQHISETNLCGPEESKNIAIRFGPEFGCLSVPGYNPTTTTTTFGPVTTTTTLNPHILTTTTTICPTICDIPNGFWATRFEVLAQKVPTGTRPNPSNWKLIDYTNTISADTVNGYITEEALTGTTFVVTQDLYNNAPFYNLNNYISLTPLGTTSPKLNFGDEYYFYGGIETDIQATIYELMYKVNLNYTEFQATSNPTWTNGSKSYITEISLLDDKKDVLVVSKLQSPVLRQGIQQFLVKFDF
jgi:hypothetical protein